MADKIETIEGSVIQHGHHNDRIYLMHLNGEAAGNLISKLDTMAIENGYGKIFAKIPATHWKAFKSADYTKEAVVPGLFRGKTDGLFIAKFFSAKRRKATFRKSFDQAERPESAVPSADRCIPPTNACTPSDAEEMAKLYRRMFKTYPFPIHQPGYLRRIMAINGRYFCIRIQKKITAIAAAEIDSANKACEMTDFVTLPDYRGNGFAGMLLERLDDEARSQGVKTAYTIARADSSGMNWVFKKRGYRYSGQLIKNSQIDGRIRSMMVWYKRL